MAVLHPGEDPGNRPQIFDRKRAAAADRPRAGVELRDLLDRCRLLEIGLEAGVLVNERAILTAALLRHRIHRVAPRRMRFADFSRHQDMFEGGAEHQLEIMPRGFRTRVFSVDDLALFGDLDSGIGGRCGLRQDRLMSGAAPAADGPAAAMEDPQPASVSCDDCGDGFVRSVERPRRGKISNFFIAVRVTQHHLLDAIPAVELTRIDGITQEALDDRRSALERLGRLEERDDVEVAPRRVCSQVVKSCQAREE